MKEGSKCSRMGKQQLYVSSIFLTRYFSESVIARLFCPLFGFLLICLILYAIIYVVRAFDPGFSSFEGGC